MRKLHEVMDAAWNWILLLFLIGLLVLIAAADTGCSQRLITWDRGDPLIPRTPHAPERTFNGEF